MYYVGIKLWDMNTTADKSMFDFYAQKLGADAYTIKKNRLFGALGVKDTKTVFAYLQATMKAKLEHLDSTTMIAPDTQSASPTTYIAEVDWTEPNWNGPIPLHPPGTLDPLDF